MVALPRRNWVCQGRGGVASTSRVKCQATRVPGLPALPGAAHRERTDPAASNGWDGARQFSWQRRGRFDRWVHGKGAAGSGSDRRRSWHTVGADAQRRSSGKLDPTRLQGHAADLGRTLGPRQGDGDRAGPSRAGRVRSTSYSPVAAYRQDNGHERGNTSTDGREPPEQDRNQAVASGRLPLRAEALRADIHRLTTAIGLPDAMK